MALVNEHFLKLQKNYLFADIAKKVNAFKATHPEANVISLGIGDVTQPLAPVVIQAMHKAVDDMATKEHFHGYGPEQGYLWYKLIAFIAWQVSNVAPFAVFEHPCTTIHYV